MTATGRTTLFVLGAAGLAVFLMWGYAGLPDFGHYLGPYGDVLNAVAVPERHVTDVVTAVNFDYRGFDTLGEEFILFAAVIGVAILLRAQRDEEEREPNEFAFGRSAPRTSDAVRGLAIGLVGPTVVTGVYIIAHGHLTPGGGFQGGVVLATGLLLVYLAGEYSFLRRAAPLSLVEVAEAVGAGAFALIGFAGVIGGVAYLENVLPLGDIGALNSAGMVPLINLSVGLEVAAGFVLILVEFLAQTLLVRLKEETTA
jgi:multicomponent Na+:H+ antiporter subunit B